MKRVGFLHQDEQLYIFKSFVAKYKTYICSEFQTSQ